MRLQQLLVSACLMAGWAGAPASAEAPVDPNGFRNWAVAILAADWRDGQGSTIDAFENAKRDLKGGFARVGFEPGNISALSLRPGAQSGVSLTTKQVFATFEEKAQAATAGCLVYFTSHGSPDGLVMGSEGLLKPSELDGLLDLWCGKRPTVVVVSACYSGTFVPALSAPNRLVMTAARPDRTSFGCGTDDIYPFYDSCVLESLPAADDFIHLANLTIGCVASREYTEQAWPPSEPLAFVGEDVESMFIFQNFEHPAPQ